MFGNSSPNFWLSDFSNVSFHDESLNRDEYTGSILARYFPIELAPEWKGVMVFNVYDFEYIV